MTKEGKLIRVRREFSPTLWLGPRPGRSVLSSERQLLSIFKDVTEAITSLEQAVQLMSNQAEPYYYPVLAREHTGDLTGAIAAREGAPERNPRWAEAHYRLDILWQKRDS